MKILKQNKIVVIAVLSSFILLMNACKNKPVVQLLVDESEKKVDVKIDGKIFTSYIYPERLKKPVLWPVFSPGGNMITRCYPMINKEGERVDHRHHVGVWLNYGDVNGLDFWNNAEIMEEEKRHLFGTIYHKSIEKTESGKGKATLVTTAEWKSPENVLMLKEQTTFQFIARENLRIIDRTTQLHAVIDEVKFTDDKEGMFGIRVARELELPSETPVVLTNKNGVPGEVPKVDLENVTGNYRNVDGIEGKEVWGTRGRWMKLWGKIKGETISVVIIDHPGNVGYPTYWHARDYGLFAANPLGQKIFSEGDKELNFSLKKGESVTFKYRLVFADENLSDAQINQLADEYEKMDMF